MSSSKDKTNRSGAGDGSVPSADPAPSIGVDEYGDPIIQGAYAGQEHADTEALTPGRQTETPATVDDPEVAARVRRAAYGYSKEDFQEQQFITAAKQARQRDIAIRVVGVGFCLWFAIYSAKYMGAVKEIKRESVDQWHTADSPHHAGANAGPANRGAVASGGTSSGPSVPLQRAPSKVSSTDVEKAMALIAEGDKLVARGDSKSAEALYREAVAILGASGEVSSEYLDAVSKLAGVLNNLNRFQEQREINDYIHRLEKSH